MAGRRPSRRQVLSYGGTAAAALAVGGTGEAALQRFTDQGRMPPAAPSRTLLNDASGLNPTRVRGITFATSSTTDTTELLKPLLGRIAQGRDPALAISGARHSMGAQSLLRDGWILETQPMNRIALDSDKQVMRVGAGATWREIIPVLNTRGYAPKVMQSNHDFTIGGSLSVNCHGWHTNSPPIASTVQSLRLLTADGTVVTCCSTKNAELFRLALGGYGMFGVVLEADIAVVPNVLLQPDFVTVPTQDYTAAFARRVYAPASQVEMAYGRLSVDPGNFLNEAIIGTYTPIPESRGRRLPLPPLPQPGARRAIFRNSATSSAGKILRWWLEREAGPWLADKVSRNSLLNEPAAVFAISTPGTTDILHEYFIPQTRLWEFVRAAQEIIPRARGNLLNVTVRDTRRDERSTLAYAGQDVFGLVMLFVQERTAVGEAQMQAMTRDLIDAAISTGGAFYLPYRLHATKEQLNRAYPAWDAAMQAKHRYDPRGVFRNELYDRYGPDRDT
ncbi:FAD-binding oxidoreductase [Streptomyces sp. NPDC005500]|uniref:FAD-binding oxidoreductase n=1 Tax=Streptomyces sp. NPDC005500 TaxID=3155007 RepID=UPI0033AAD6CC